MATSPRFVPAVYARHALDRRSIEKANEHADPRTDYGPLREPLLEFRSVKKIYGGGKARVRALAGVSFQIRAGEFVAMMGPGAR